MDLENFWPISKSRKQMDLEVSFSGDFWASESRILMPTGLGVSDLSCFVLFFFFFGLLESKFSEFMYATAYQTEPVNKRHKTVNKTKQYIGGLSLASSYDFGHFV